MTKIVKYISRWFVLGNIFRPIIPFTVNLLYWKPSKTTDNVGDLLSLVVYKNMLKLGGMNHHPLTPNTKRIVSIGSVLSFVGSGHTTVWGTGLMNAECVTALTAKNAKLDIRAVRGPKTRERLTHSGFICPSVFGDPAILLPCFYNPTIQKVAGKIVIILHHSKFEKYSTQYKNVLDTYTSDWQNFVREIKSAEKVISSSLHGIILAESYGVPCVWLNDIPDSSFKYEDYYQSTGRTNYPLANSIEEAMTIPGEINQSLQKMQAALRESFPYDLF